MRCFADGDQLCMVLDDFENLQESPSAEGRVRTLTKRHPPQNGRKGL